MASLTRKVYYPIVSLTLRGTSNSSKILHRCYKTNYPSNRTPAYKAPRRIYPNNNTTTNEIVEEHRTSPLTQKQQQQVVEDFDVNTEVLRDYKFISPEFLPDPNLWLRDRLLEKVEREDMYRRRELIQIPEFYVGSLLAVTVSDNFAPGKQNRFVGICIERLFQGLRATFTLRNIISGQGMEIRYLLYSPLILDIEVLKLEKRLDEHLRYLRDCPPEYSTVPFDMEPRPHPGGSYIPVNKIQVPLNSRPWQEKWEIQDLKGIQEIKHNWSEKQTRKMKINKTEQELNKFDLMKHYRESINDAEKTHIYREVLGRLRKIKEKRDLEKRKSKTL